jgi:hypothetical protein
LTLRTLPATSRRAATSGWLAGLLAVAALGLAQTGPGQSLLEDAGLRGGAGQGYTELAFATPARLPRDLAAARTVAFTVHNAEGADRRYGWTLRLRDGQASTDVGHGELALAEDGRGTVAARLPDVCAGATRRTKYQVSVALDTPQRQTIAFYAACRRAADG